MVVETMKKEHLSIHATMQEFGINDHKIIERWERIYLEEGPEGLAIERRGPVSYTHLITQRCSPSVPKAPCSPCAFAVRRAPLRYAAGQPRP